MFPTADEVALDDGKRSPQNTDLNEIHMGRYPEYLVRVYSFGILVPVGALAMLG